MEGLAPVLEFVVALLLSGGAVAALVWSVRRGGWRDWEREAESIFDEEEPRGRLTDGFPAGRRKPKLNAGPADR